MEYNIANMTNEAIEIISKAENQIKSQTGADVVLIAYKPELKK